MFVSWSSLEESSALQFARWPPVTPKSSSAYIIMNIKGQLIVLYLAYAMTSSSVLLAKAMLPTCTDSFSRKSERDLMKAAFSSRYILSKPFSTGVPGTRKSERVTSCTVSRLILGEASASLGLYCDRRIKKILVALVKPKSICFLYHCTTGYKSDLIWGYFCLMTMGRGRGV